MSLTEFVSISSVDPNGYRNLQRFSAYIVVEVLRFQFAEKLEKVQNGVVETFYVCNGLSFRVTLLLGKCLFF